MKQSHLLIHVLFIAKHWKKKYQNEEILCYVFTVGRHGQGKNYWNGPESRSPKSGVPPLRDSGVRSPSKFEGLHIPAYLPSWTTRTACNGRSIQFWLWFLASLIETDFMIVPSRLHVLWLIWVSVLIDFFAHTSLRLSLRSAAACSESLLLLRVWDIIYSAK